MINKFSLLENQEYFYNNKSASKVVWKTITDIEKTFVGKYMSSTVFVFLIDIFN